MKKKINRGIFIFGICFSLVACTQKNNEVSTPTENYDYEEIVTGMGIPWGIAFLPDGGMLITEKKGAITYYKDGKKRLLENIPEVYNRGQGGLMDVKLHPDFSENNTIYLTYASAEGEGSGGNTALMKAKLTGNSLSETEVLYKATPNTTKGQHFGSRIEFDNEGYLYFSIGERGNRDENPQDITRDGGKIYRLHADGTIPQDNPFVDEDGAKKAIYSFGHRNPQGMDLHPETGELWIHEHGPKGGDEINQIKKGRNYGWPVITYGKNYSGTDITDKTSQPDMEQPLYHWTPSIAPSGMIFVTSEKYPELKGNLLVGSLKFQYLEHCVLEGEKVIRREKLLEDIGRVRSVVQAPNGYIYVGVENLGVVKIIPPKE